MPVIINTSHNCNGSWWTKHLTKTKAVDPVHGNDRVKVVELRGLVARGIGSALNEMLQDAEHTPGYFLNDKKPDHFLQANINPVEILTRGQAVEAADILELTLGLKNHARFIVEHEKKGRVHWHVIWSLLDPQTGKLKVVWNDNFKAMKAAEKIEKKFGLKPLENRWKFKNGLKSWEVFGGKKNGLDPDVVIKEVTALWHKTKTGQQFKAALEKHGYILARGNKKDVYMLVDKAGGVAELRRRIRPEGKGFVLGAVLQERMKDVPLSSLPYASNAVRTVRALLKAKRQAHAKTAGKTITHRPKVHAPAAPTRPSVYKTHHTPPDKPVRAPKPAPAPSPTLEDLIPSVGSGGGLGWPPEMIAEYKLAKSSGGLASWTKRWAYYLSKRPRRAHPPGP